MLSMRRFLCGHGAAEMQLAWVRIRTRAKRFKLFMMGNNELDRLPAGGSENWRPTARFKDEILVASILGTTSNTMLDTLTALRQTERRNNGLRMRPSKDDALYSHVSVVNQRFPIESCPSFHCVRTAHSVITSFCKARVTPWQSLAGG